MYYDVNIGMNTAGGNTMTVSEIRKTIGGFLCSHRVVRKVGENVFVATLKFDNFDEMTDMVSKFALLLEQKTIAVKDLTTEKGYIVANPMYPCVFQIPDCEFDNSLFINNSMHTKTSKGVDVNRGGF